MTGVRMIYYSKSTFSSLFWQQLQIMQKACSSSAQRERTWGSLVFSKVSKATGTYDIFHGIVWILNCLKWGVLKAFVKPSVSSHALGRDSGVTLLKSLEHESQTPELGQSVSGLWSGTWVMPGAKAPGTEPES